MIYYKKDEDKEYIEVKAENVKSDFKIISGDKNKFKLEYRGKGIFWAKIKKFYEGVLYIRGYNENFFPYINSLDIESRKNLTDYEKLYSWSKFFIKKLEEINFYYEGIWHLTYYKGNDSFYENQKGRKIYAYDEYARGEAVAYLDWDEDKILGTKKEENIDAGRLKWWRKKAKENSLPPILLWYIPPLDSFIIIDGHSRLKASILEGKRPDFVVVGPFRKVVVPRNEKIIKKIIDSIKNSEKNSEISVEKLNNIMIRLYCENEFYKNNLISEGRYDFEKIWDKEVKELIKDKKYLELLLE